MEKIVNSVAEYAKLVVDAEKNTICNGAEKNEKLLFRGQEDKNYDLIPSIGRNRMTSCDITMLNEERNLIEMAKYKIPDVFRKDMDPVELLALLQHHGIPTRLLDVTENALVALYFACESKKECDAEIIIFKQNELDVTTYPVVNAIADSYRFARTTFIPLDSFYNDVIIQPYFVEQYNMLADCHKDNGGEWINECCQKPIFIYAPIRTRRQQSQMGRYILFPNRIEQNSMGKCFIKVIDPIKKDADCIADIITIPYTVKKSILNELRLFGITRETLFCDNTDIICKEIVNDYNKKILGE